MTYRSMAKTAPDKIKDIDEKNPENHQTQSVEENALDPHKYSQIYSSEKGYHNCGRRY